MAFSFFQPIGSDVAAGDTTANQYYEDLLGAVEGADEERVEDLLESEMVRNITDEQGQAIMARAGTLRSSASGEERNIRTSIYNTLQTSRLNIPPVAVNVNIGSILPRLQGS